MSRRIKEFLRTPPISTPAFLIIFALLLAASWIFITTQSLMKERREHEQKAHLVAEEFLKAIRENRLDDAYALTSLSYQELGREQFTEFVAKEQVLRGELNFIDWSINGPFVLFAGWGGRTDPYLVRPITIYTGRTPTVNGKQTHVRVDVIKENGKFRVNDCRIYVVELPK